MIQTILCMYGYDTTKEEEYRYGSPIQRMKFFHFDALIGRKLSCGGIVGFLIWAIEKINGVNDTYLIQRP